MARRAKYITIEVENDDETYSDVITDEQWTELAPAEKWLTTTVGVDGNRYRFARVLKIVECNVVKTTKITLAEVKPPRAAKGSDE